MSWRRRKDEEENDKKKWLDNRTKFPFDIFNDESFTNDLIKGFFKSIEEMMEMSEDSMDGKVKQYGIHPVQCA